MLYELNSSTVILQKTTLLSFYVAHRQKWDNLENSFFAKTIEIKSTKLHISIFEIERVMLI